ncbi:MAG: DUF4129 domain-containing protein [Chitinophagales bacterium]
MQTRFSLHITLKLNIFLKTLILGISLCCFNSSLQAQLDSLSIEEKIDSLSLQPEIDSVLLQKSENYPIEVRNFDSNKLQKHLESSDFYYDRPPPKPGLLERFFNWLGRKENSSFLKTLDFLWKYGKFILMVIVLIYVIQRLLNANFATLFMKKPKQQGIQYQVMEENIHELDFDQLIEEAIKKRHFRRAIRLFYLKNLKLMTDKNLINWRPYKTNYDYQLELNNTPFSTPFSKLTYLFNHVWYGNFQLTEELFQDAKAQFVEFEGLVNGK